MFRQDTEERVRLRRGFQVEVMLADDALRIARLNRRFADGAKLCDEHRNERMPEHVVRESEFLRELQPALLKIADDQREFVEWVGAQPGREVRLDRYPARLPAVCGPRGHRDKADNNALGG